MSEADGTSLPSNPHFSADDETVSRGSCRVLVDDRPNGSSAAASVEVNDSGGNVTRSDETTVEGAKASNVGKLTQICAQLRRNVNNAYETVAEEARGYYDTLSTIIEDRRRTFLDCLEADKQQKFFLTDVENFVKEHGEILESEPAAFRAVLERLQEMASLNDPKSSWFGVQPNTTIIKELSVGKNKIFVNPVFSCFFRTRRIEKVVQELNSINLKKPATAEPLKNPAKNIEKEVQTIPPDVTPTPLTLLSAAEAPGEIESVRIISIKSPQEFYVLRRSDKELWSTVNSYFQNQVDSLAQPETVELGQMYAVFTADGDSRWYRGRAGRRCGCYYVGSVAHPLYDFFLVDRGSSADIRLCDVRNLDDAVLNIPPLAKPCSLSRICPREGTSWSRESCQEFLDVVTKGHVGMKTFHEEGGVYHVDLSVIISDEKSIPSVRDWLMLRCLASLPSSGNEPQLKQLTSQAQHIRRREIFQAVSSYCESPDIVYFQRMDQADRILDLQLQLQEAYLNPTTSYTAGCFDPRKGLLCAALYEGEYYRALVEDIDPDGRVAIFYVDYGNRERVYAGQLRELAPRFTEMEAQAIRCSIRKTGTTSRRENLMAQVANSALCRLKVITVLKGHVGKVGNKKEFCLIVEINLVDENAISEGNHVPEVEFAGSAEAQQLDAVATVPAATTELLNPTNKEDPVSTNVELHEESRNRCDNPVSKVSDSNYTIEQLAPADVEEYRVDASVQNEPEPYVRQGVSATPAAIEADSAAADPVPGDENDPAEELSPMDEYALQCLYKHSDSPSLIYVVPPLMEVKFQELDDQMQVLYKDRLPLPFSSLTVGNEYCVKAKGVFCRGRINHITDDESISVFLIDYGKKIITSAGSFFQLEEEHGLLQSGLITCELYGIEPVSFCWRDEAIAAVDSILAESVCIYLRACGKPRRPYRGTPASLPVELTVEMSNAENQPVQFSLNEYLVHQGWAKFTQDHKVTCWLPAVAPKRKVFDGLVTWITYEGNVFIQDSANADLVIDMSRRLKGRYRNSQPDPDAKWVKGDACIAWFDGDDGWHRATITGCPPASYRVHFVDYGTGLESAVEELRKPPGFVASVPVQGWECRLHDIVPPNGEDTWTVAVLDQIHALLIEKSCTVRLHGLGQNPPYKVSLTLSDGRDVGSVLVEMGLASFAPKPQIAPCPLPSVNEGKFHFPVMIAQVKGLRLTILPDVGIPAEENLEKLDTYKKWVAARHKVDQMHMELDQSQMEPLKDVSSGTVCLARNEDQFSRAVVLELDQNTITLDLVDFGTVVKKAATDLFQLPSKYLNIPRLSFTAQPSGLKLAPGVSMETATRKLSKAAIKYPLWALFQGENDEQTPLIDLLAFDAEDGQKCLAYESYVKKGIFQYQ